MIFYRFDRVLLEEYAFGGKFDKNLYLICIQCFEVAIPIMIAKIVTKFVLIGCFVQKGRESL